MVTLALAGDTMLGRTVAEAIDHGAALFDDDVLEITRAADLFVLNLECCISERGARWPDPRKPFFFRAPPAAVTTLCALGVDCVTLANNHALDYGPVALADTFDHLRAAGIPWVGAGRTLAQARAAVVLEARGLRIGVLGCSDHPAEFSAGDDSPGIAYRLDWVPAAIDALDADVVLVTPHWGPNMTRRPPQSVRRAAARLLDAGATLVAGHSAHVFHGVAPRVLFDMGDFIDDYAVDHELRNDLGLLFLVTLDEGGPHRLEAVPLTLGFCHTALALGEDAAWIRRRFRSACAELGTETTEEGSRVVADLRPRGG